MGISKIYTAEDLIEKALEFSAMTPDSSSWKESELKSNPPRLIRLRQINSLLDAFFNQKQNSFIADKALLSSNNKVTIESFFSGEFIEQRDIDDYSELVTEIKSLVHEKEIQASSFFQEVRINELVEVYKILLEYKKQSRKLFTFNSGWIEASSISSRFTIYLTKSINKEIKDKFTQLNEVLSLLISPKRETFSESELINKFNYPTEDLYEIDMEFI